LRLFEGDDEASLIRWDQTFIRPASEAGRLGFALFKEALSTIEPTRVALAARGDTLLIDNWRMLHARSSVPADCRDRLLERAYLEVVH
jgi:hypothetical protein